MHFSRHLSGKTLSVLNVMFMWIIKSMGYALIFLCGEKNKINKKTFFGFFCTAFSHYGFKTGG
jgi:hypothetical protein